MGMALAAVADDHHLLALHQVHVGITVIVNAHGRFLLIAAAAARLRNAAF
jgi:hypothetical protein